MPNPACPACTLDDVLSHSAHWECATCGHEWPKEAVQEVARIVKDAHGNVLVDGDTVALIKDSTYALDSPFGIPVRMSEWPKCPS